METKILKSSVKCLTELEVYDGYQKMEVDFNNDIQAIVEIDQTSETTSYYHLPDETIYTTQVSIVEAWQWDGQIKLPYYDHTNLENAIIQKL